MQTVVLLLALAATGFASDWREVVELHPAPTAANDDFGLACDLEGDTLVVGSAFTDLPGRSDAGAVFVFRRAGGTWTQIQMLTASDATAQAEFGTEIDLDGDTLAIGAPTSATPGSAPGAVYVFVFDGASWIEQQKLVAPGGSSADAFGRGVALREDRLAVGAENADVAGARSGALYVYERTGTSWSFVAPVLTAVGAGSGQNLGRSVELEGDLLVAGAHEDGPGSAHVFRRSPAGAWEAEAELTPFDGAPGDRFGRSVGLAGDWLAVSSYRDDDNGDESGSIYVYRHVSGAWSFQQKVVPADGSAGDDFGKSLALRGDVLCAASVRDDDVGASAGALYAYRRVGPTWELERKLYASSPAPGELFGLSVAIDGDRLAVGAPKDSDWAASAGSIHLLERGGVGTVYCAGDDAGTACPCGNSSPPGAGAGCLHSLGQAGRLTAVGSASVSLDSLSLNASGMPDSTALCFQGSDAVAGGAGSVFGDGLRCAGGTTLRLGSQVNVAGASCWPRAGDPPLSTQGLLPATGGTRRYQVWYRNAATFCTASTFNLSNGLEIDWAP